MTKKRKQHKPATVSNAAAPIQYRPGRLFADLLATLSVDWQISVNETARRLAVLAAHHFDVRHYGLINSYASQMPGHGDFCHACHRLYIAMTAVNRDRLQNGGSIMAEAERTEFLHGLCHRHTVKEG